MLPRFYCQLIPGRGETVPLTLEESRHVLAAKRLRGGDRIELFDGVKILAECTIVEADPHQRQVVVRVEHCFDVPESSVEYHLAAGLPKGDRQAVMLNMATQLGMSAFTPLDCARSVVKARASSAQRWQKIMIEACKQSRRVAIPQLYPSKTVGQLLGEVDLDRVVFMADPSGKPTRMTYRNSGARRWIVLIGPEGGFTSDEVNTARDYGAQIGSLGDSILRTETAAVAALCNVRYCFS